MADISPSQTQRFESGVVYTYETLIYRTAAAIGNQTLNATPKTFSPFAPATGSTLVIPSQFDQQSYNYSAKFIATAYVQGEDVSGFTFFLPLTLLSFGNVDAILGGTSPILIDGAPAPKTLSGANFDIFFQTPISKINIPTISAQYATDLGSLVSTPIFTPSAVAATWRAYILLSVQVMLKRYGTN